MKLNSSWSWSALLIACIPVMLQPGLIYLEGEGLKFKCDEGRIRDRIRDRHCETMNLHKEMINVDLNVSHPKIPTV